MDEKKKAMFMGYMKMMLWKVNEEMEKSYTIIRDPAKTPQEKAIQSTLLSAQLAESQVYDTLIVWFEMLL